MLNFLENYFVKRHFKKRFIQTNPHDTKEATEFKKVLNTLRENKVMVSTKDDGIYIRLAGNENSGYSFSTEWAKVKSFKQ
jgi:hypothetical protein